MEPRVERADGVAVLRPEGQLTGASASSVKEEARRLLAQGRDLVMDLSGVPFADSEGLSTLVALFKSASAASRRFALAAVRFNLKALLELTRLHRVFEVHEDVEAAIDALRERDG